MKRTEAGGLVASSFKTLPRFKLVRPASAAEAVAALASDSGAAILAGGTDLPARFNEGFAPTTLVDLSRITALRTIDIRDGCLAIGAMVTHAAGSTHPLVRDHLPSFGRAWSRIANVRIRMSATLAGNLMARRTRYEGAILLAALGARLRLTTPTGETEIPAEDCFEAPPVALLTEILIPLSPGLTLDYERSMRPVMTQAVAIDAQGDGRMVTATEFVRPRIAHLAAGAPAAGALPPERFGDPVAGDGYLNTVRSVFLRRQLQRARAA